MMRTCLGIGALLLASICGCGPIGYSALSTHTVAIGADTQVDVVWLEDTGGRVYRCIGTQSGGQCAPASGLR